MIVPTLATVQCSPAPALAAERTRSGGRRLVVTDFLHSRRRIGPIRSRSVRRGRPASSQIEKEASMIYALLGYVQATIEWRLRAIRALVGGERGQGTVEYVGLILLVSLLMVGMVAAMKGFNGKQGTELAGVIVDKIKQAVDKVAFK